MGWNNLRDQIFANQKILGVIQQYAQLTPWPDDLLKKWDDLSPDEKKLFERTNGKSTQRTLPTRITRSCCVIQAVEDMGKLDDTLTD